MVLDFNTLYGFPHRMDRLFEQVFSPVRTTRRTVAYPPINLGSDEENIYVRAEIPGVGMDDVELTLTEKSLVIKGERKPVEGRHIRQERPAGVFHRVVTLGVPVDREKVVANLKDGVLSVVLPKAESVKPRKISIEAE